MATTHQFPLSRRQRQSSLAALCSLAGLATHSRDDSSAAEQRPAALADETFAFIRRCARDDGGYTPSPDPAYQGNSDTGSSDLAAVTYAATLAKTLGWQLPHPERSVEFIQHHQQADGSFVNQGGKMDPQSDLAVLYNTVQGVVALRALGQRPQIDPARCRIDSSPAMRSRNCPGTRPVSFRCSTPLLGKPFPEPYDQALHDLQVRSQGEDGYLGDHVAASFHMAHYFRLIGQPDAEGGANGRARAPGPKA